VQYTFTYFDGDKTIRVDEPLVLRAAEIWFNGKGFPSNEYVVDSFCDPHLAEEAVRRTALFSILPRHFKAPHRLLHHVFIFHGTPLPWSQDSAELVAMSIDDGNISLSQVDMSPSRLASVCLGTTRRATPEIWYSFTIRKTSLLFPSNYLGHDLVFVLRYGLSSRLNTILNARWTRPQLRKTVTPSKFYVQKARY